MNKLKLARQMLIKSTLLFFAPVIMIACTAPSMQNRIDEIDVRQYENISALIPAFYPNYEVVYTRSYNSSLAAHKNKHISDMTDVPGIYAVFDKYCQQKYGGQLEDIKRTIVARAEFNPAALTECHTNGEHNFAVALLKKSTEVEKVVSYFVKNTFSVKYVNFDVLSRLQQERIKRTENSKRAKEESRARLARVEAENQRRIQAFRQNIHSGDLSQCGLVVEVKEDLALVQMQSSQRWVYVEELNPANLAGKYTLNKCKYEE